MQFSAEGVNALKDIILVIAGAVASRLVGPTGNGADKPTVPSA